VITFTAVFSSAAQHTSEKLQFKSLKKMQQSLETPVVFPDTFHA